MKGLKIMEQQSQIKIGGLMPLQNIHPIVKNKILAVLKKYTFEEQLLALLLWHMIKQFDEPTQRLPYIQKNLKKLARINAATRYVKSIIDATNRVWLDSFKELPKDVSIAGFTKTIIFRREASFKKMGIDIKDFIRLDKLHGETTLTLPTLKVISLMLKKIDAEVEVDRLDVEEYHRLKNK